MLMPTLPLVIVSWMWEVGMKRDLLCGDAFEDDGKDGKVLELYRSTCLPGDGWSGS